MDVIDQMRLFFEPRSVAVIGASRRTGYEHFNLLESMITYGYPGKIYPVNPNADEIFGIRAYHNINELPEMVELAIIGTPRSEVLHAMRSCIRKGIKAVIIFSQGFAEADEEGKALQKEIAEIAREAGTRILGPNTLGVTNGFYGFSSGFAQLERSKLPIAVVSQTGMILQGFTRSTIFGKGIDLGNMCDIDFVDVLEYLEDDPEVKVIFLHMEGIKRGRKFLEVARRVSKKKPLLVLKTGRSNRGREAIRSHSGSLAGEDIIYDGAFKQCGVIRLKSIDELQDMAKTFLNFSWVEVRRMAIITATGGGGIIATDACEESNLELAQLSRETLGKVEDLSPPWFSIGNPVDIWPASLVHGYPKVFGVALGAVLSDKNVDAVLCVLPSPVHKVFDVSGIIERTAAKFDGKPIVIWRAGYLYSEEQVALFEKNRKAVVYPTGERAVRALATLTEYAKIRNSKD